MKITRTELDKMGLKELKELEQQSYKQWNKVRSYLRFKEEWDE